MSQVVLSQYAEQNGLVDFTQAASGVAGILHLATVSFFTVAIAPNAATPLASFTFSVDANLIGVAVTWSAPYRRAVGGVAVDSQNILAQLASGANAGTVFGYAVLDAAGTNWVYAEVFDTPQVLVDTLSGFGLVSQFALGGPNFGSATLAT